MPLPLLLILAIAAVAADRLGRRAPLALLPVLVIGVALAGVGARLAGEPAAVAPARSPASAAVAPGVKAVEPQAASERAPAAVAAAEEPPALLEEPPATGAELAGPTADPTPELAGLPSNAGGPRYEALLTTPAPAAAQAAAAPTAQVASAGTVTIPILMYHYVRVVNDPKDQVGINLSVRPEAFAAQMQYLADKGYTTLTMAEVHAILAGQQPVPPKPIALTFDDGYRDFYSAAWPVLQRHGFKATAYIATDFIGWDAYMTWPMLHELDASGLIEFGAHTRSHADLRTVSAARRWDEIIGSKAILEEGLGHPVGSFCYPAGFRNAEVVADVRRARFLTAVTVQHGKAQNLQWAYELPRIRVHGPDPLAAWASKLP